MAPHVDACNWRCDEFSPRLFFFWFPVVQVAFVWNRTPSKLDGEVPAELVCTNLDDFAKFGADVIVEVAHPSITRSHGAAFIAAADFFVGSPTAFADAELEAAIRKAAAAEVAHGVYVPSGALWGATDIQKMADRGSLKGLTITMAKHPSSLKVLGELQDKLAAAKDADGATVLYSGPVRGLCPLAPNNVNTMACAALAGHSLGFDGTQARLVSDASLTAHVITIEVEGPSGAAGTFEVSTRRYNPAAVGAVTGNATYASFLSSLLATGGRGPGMHFC